jgi:hypothetical protein
MEQNHVWEVDIGSVDHKTPRLIETSRSLLSVDQSAVGRHSEAERSGTGKVRPVTGYETRDGEKLYSVA